ncbi:MAG: hypothetical protein NC543_04800 [bacterium]|nr:hypothetical protein [bacterium]MCM1374857.1 hypothetical protein [Muribaculum sp.]
MNIFFCCTSMAHLFTAAYIAEKYHKQASRKYLILLSQMKEMIKLIPNIMRAEVWNDIRVIDNEAKEIAFIQEQIEALLREDKSKFYLFGFENVSFSIVHMSSRDDMVAYVDDGGMSYNFREGLRKTYHKELFADREFPVEKIQELWLTEPKMLVDDFGAICRELQIGVDLHNKTFYGDFLNKLKIIFDIHDVHESDYNIVYFDTYLASIGWISIEFEEFMLQEIVGLVGNSRIAMKAHPNETYWEKYSKLNLSLLENSIVPWEVTALLQNKVSTGLRIYMTNVSSVVLKQRLVLGDNESYIIFLYRIYEKYCPGLKDKLETASVDRYMEVTGDNRMFFPQDFEELRKVLEQIGFKKPDEGDVKREAEEFFIEKYWDLWKETPSHFNFSTIYYKGKEKKLPIVLNSRSLKVSLEFDLQTAENTTYKTEGVGLFWYVLRGIAVRVRIEHIVYESEGGKKRDITINEISQIGEKDERGYFVQYNLDAVYKLPIVDWDITKITIDAEICVLDTYEEVGNVFRERMRVDSEDKVGLLKKLEEEQRTVRKLLDDIEVRDKVCEQSKCDIEDRDKICEQLMRDIEDRDKVCEQLMRDIEDRDSIHNHLVRDIEDRDAVLRQLLDDISGRDSLIRQLEEDKRGKEQYISDLEGRITDFQNSFWGRIYGKCKR